MAEEALKFAAFVALALLAFWLGYVLEDVLPAGWFVWDE